MTLDVQDFARAQFRATLEQRSKKISPLLFAALENAFDLQEVAEIAASKRSPGFDARRLEDIDRDQIGRLARGLGHMIASSSEAEEIGAEDIRLGFARWRATRSYRTIAPRYHSRLSGGVGKDAIIANLT